MKLATFLLTALAAFWLTAAATGAQEQKKPDSGKAADSKPAPPKKEIGVNEPGVNRKAPLTVNEEGIEEPQSKSAKKRASDKEGNHRLPPRDDPAKKQVPKK